MHMSRRMRICAWSRDSLYIHMDIRTRAHTACAGMRERKVVSGLGIWTMKGSHPFAVHQNSDTVRSLEGDPARKVGEALIKKRGEGERARKRGHVISSRFEVIFREYVPGDSSQIYA